MPSATASLAASLASLPPPTRTALLAEFSDAELAALEHDWAFWGRPAQLAPPGDWRVWLLLGGRGSGKTLALTQHLRREIEAGRADRVALVGETAADCRDVLVEGPSGLLTIAPPDRRPLYEPSKRRVTYPNGAVVTLYAASDPEQLRGPEHALAGCDELGKWAYGESTWSNLLFGLRRGADPRVVCATTPRPTPLVKRLIDDPTVAKSRMRTDENLANLPPLFLEQVVAPYRGTRLGRQELDGELLAEVEGALWRRDWLEAGRVRAAPELRRVVVALDPPGESSVGAAEAGIVVAGVGRDGHGYVLADRSRRSTPAQWAAAALEAMREYGGDRLTAEVNQGGQMVEATLRTIDPTVSYRAVRAARGKQARAEPVAALYERGLVHHVGAFPALEDQLCTWTTEDGESPDRLDALVWALTDLMLGGPRGAAGF